MYLKEIITISYRSIMASKLRGVLTMLGIIIGVGCVIAIISLGAGVQQGVTDMIKRYGANLLYIRPEYRRRGRVRRASGSGGRLYNKDFAALRQEATLLRHVSPEVGGSSQVVFGPKNVNTQVLGVFPFWPGMHNWVIERGRFFADHENRGKLRVCVIGDHIRKELFKEENPIGQTIKIKRIPFTVVGLLQARGSSGWHNQDDIVVVPFYTAQVRLYGMGNRIHKINVQVANEANMELAKEEVTQILRRLHRLRPEEPEDFRLYNQADWIRMNAEFNSSLTAVGAVIAFVSLLVGGIGIMNIMLVSVTERTKEIGLRKAVGAKTGDILVQFLVEAVLLCLIGGLVGILLGVGLTYITTKGLPGMVKAFGNLKSVPLIIPTFAIIVSFGTSFAIGVLFGLYPAIKAARMNPIDALRVE